jgi:hypothetical protein
MAKVEDKKDSRRANGALFIPAGIFLGLGYGFLISNIPAGLFIGLGLGFVAFAIIAIAKSKCC